MRLEKVLPHLIESDQTGYIKGRFIGENIRLISDIIEKHENKEGMILSQVAQAPKEAVNMTLRNSVIFIKSLNGNRTIVQNSSNTIETQVIHRRWEGKSILLNLLALF